MNNQKKPALEKLTITQATNAERTWAAKLMASTEPWITLGITFEKSLALCHDLEYIVFIGHWGDNPCGFVILHMRGLASSPYIKSIAIADGYRSKGIGAAMLGFVENFCRGQARHLFLCVSSFNIRAKEFYERMGFHAVGELTDYIIDGASEIILHKRL
jgi:ribosomal protein S18 acetylase RimI-like enzyme